MRRGEVRCRVYRVENAAGAERRRLDEPVRELLPWADPYIAMLVRQLERAGEESDGESHLESRSLPTTAESPDSNPLHAPRSSWRYHPTDWADGDGQL